MCMWGDKLLLVGGLEASTHQATNQLWVFEEGEQTWTSSPPPYCSLSGEPGNEARTDNRQTQPIA